MNTHIEKIYENIFSIFKKVDYSTEINFSINKKSFLSSLFLILSVSLHEVIAICFDS